MSIIETYRQRLGHLQGVISSQGRALVAENSRNRELARALEAERQLCSEYRETVRQLRLQLEVVDPPARSLLADATDEAGAKLSQAEIDHLSRH